MEITPQHPLVSVAVIAYNSAEYILETLESIKSQTYDNIELIVSDDCSTDNTLDICRKWMDDNKSRFLEVRIVESPNNTGQSGNYNRAFYACAGEWIKEIDGDDKLLPDCISDFILYTEQHPEAKYIFGKMVHFGKEVSGEKNLEHDYSFFTLPTELQLHKLIYEGNYIPSASSFYNKPFIQQLGFRCDERIPLLEDYPKWIKLLQLGVHFYFLDKNVVEYRIGNGISSRKVYSIPFFRSLVLCNCYYRYPYMLAENKSTAVNKIADDFCELYKNKIEVERLRHTHAYLLGKKILTPFSTIKRITSTLCQKIMKKPS